MATPVGYRSKPPCPAGLHVAVCCDVVDKGVVTTAWGDKHQVQIRWQIDMLNDEGKPYVVRKDYTASLAPKANLAKDLESWRGRAFSETERQNFDLDRLLGIGCQVNVTHKLSDGGTTYANVVNVLPLSRGQQPPAIDKGYVRQKDREQQQSHDTQRGFPNTPDPWAAPAEPEAEP